MVTKSKEIQEGNQHLDRGKALGEFLNFAVFSLRVSSLTI